MDWRVVGTAALDVPTAELDRAMDVLESAIQNAPAGVLEVIVERVHTWAGRAVVRLARRGVPSPAATPAAPVALESRRYITVEEAAAITGLQPQWLIRHTRGLSFRRKLSRKKIRFDEAGFRRWIESRRP